MLSSLWLLRVKMPRLLVLNHTTPAGSARLTPVAGGADLACVRR